MNGQTSFRNCIIAVLLVLLPNLSAAQAQSESPGAAHYIGSGLLSILYLPIKLATCVGTGTVTSIAYAATYQVPGNHHGGTNGKEIGEVARGACGGSWLISAADVKQDYGSPRLLRTTGPAQETNELDATVSGDSDTTVQVAKATDTSLDSMRIKESVREVPTIIEIEKVVLPDVAFRFDSAELTDLGKGTLYLASQKIKQHPQAVVTVRGHADYIGTDEYNQQLGLRRAEAVKKELAQLGVDAKMFVESSGASEPLIVERTDWARAVNRRVEISIGESN